MFLQHTVVCSKCHITVRKLKRQSCIGEVVRAVEKQEQTAAEKGKTFTMCADAVKKETTHGTCYIV